MEAAQVEDESLVRETLAGSQASFQLLVERYQERIFSLARHYTRNAVDVEDLVQDTFLVALERMGGFDGRSSLHTWLCGIAKNKIRDARRTRRPQSLQDALLEADPEIEAILAQIAREPLPEHVLELAETRDLVGATLSSLPPDYAQALVQKYVEGRSVAEIARDAKKGDKAIESVLTRARAAFARVFELLAEKRGGLR